MGVYSAMSAVGTVVGLIAGGLLVAYASWRWVMFVNVPIGIAAALAAPAVLPAAPRRSGGGSTCPAPLPAPREWADSGAAASLLNAGRQVGGSIGLAVLGTVAWTVVADSARAQAAAAARAAAPMPAATWRAAYQHALAAGFDRAFLVAAAIAVLILVVAIATIRVRRADLAGR